MCEREEECKAPTSKIVQNVFVKDSKTTILLGGNSIRWQGEGGAGNKFQLGAFIDIYGILKHQQVLRN